MNNYCTNCGKKLEKDELVCENCNTPIIDLSYDSDCKLPEEVARTIKIFGVWVLCLLVIIVAITSINKTIVNKLQKEYVEPYLKENYGNVDYSIKYDSSGKCIVSGNCSDDVLRGCDGLSICDEYEYLEKKECKSYYYSVKTDTDEFVVTVVKRNKQFSVVRGKNIYGSDE